MKRRLFTAVQPTDSFIDAATSLHEGLPGARWETHPHVTLSHFGDVEASLVPDLQAELAAVSLEPFELQPDRFGFFKDADAPAVVWVGFAPSAELVSLHAELSIIRSRFASRPDRHDFNPHLTLARTGECDPDDVEHPDDVELYLTRPFDEAGLGTLWVSGFGLFESVDFRYLMLGFFDCSE